MNLKYTILFIFCFVVSSFTTNAQNNTYSIPEAALVELYRLEEAYNILDQFSEDIWPGWTNYKEFPFLFEFQNGLRILIGHPDPPDEFTKYEKLLVSGLKVYVDISKLTEFEINQPFQCGGGIIPLGVHNNRRVNIVNLKLTRKKPPERIYSKNP